jgi:hypothetical protein
MINKSFNIMFKTPESGIEIIEVHSLYEDDEDFELLELEVLKKIMENDILERSENESLKDMFMAVIQDTKMIDACTKSSAYELSANDIDTTRRTYIVNKDLDVEGIEIGIYESAYEDDIEDYKVFDLQEFTSKYGVEKTAFRDLKDSGLLDLRMVTLNGLLGKTIHDSAVKSDFGHCYTSVEKIEKEVFENNLVFLVSSKINQFKVDNNIDSISSLERFHNLLDNSLNDTIKYDSDSNYLIIKLTETSNLHIAIDTLNEKEIFEAKFYEKDVFLENTITNQKIRVRSIDEVDGNILYMDSKLSNFINYIKGYEESNKLLTKEMLGNKTKAELRTINNQNNENLIKLVNESGQKEIDIKVIFETHTSQIEIWVKNNDVEENLSHKLYVNLTEEGDLKLAIVESKMDTKEIASFLKKTKSSNAMNDIIEKININKVDYINIINNHNLIEECKYDIDLEAHNKVKNKKIKR